MLAVYFQAFATVLNFGVWLMTGAGINLVFFLICAACLAWSIAEFRRT